MKIRLVWAELFHADRPTDMTDLIVAVRSFTNAPKTYDFVVSSVRVILKVSCKSVRWLKGEMGRHNVVPITLRSFPFH